MHVPVADLLCWSQLVIFDLADASYACSLSMNGSTKLSPLDSVSTAAERVGVVVPFMPADDMTTRGDLTRSGTNRGLSEHVGIGCCW